LSKAFWQKGVAEVLAAGDRYGESELGQGRRVQVEYVSANPTGPLHIGHGRGAALGDSLARILRKTGHEVSTEYYINDAGRQMMLLGRSIWYRAMQALGREVAEPEDYYKGAYIKDLAAEVLAGDSASGGGAALFDGPEQAALDVCQAHGVDRIMAGIKQDLKDFRVEHQVWFSEKSLVSAGLVEETFKTLLARDLAYEKDGALWFRSTNFRDEKDRVLRKQTGDLTYFASDIAYHDDKYRRGFDLVVDIWGADHHGYVARMQGAVSALGKDPDENFKVILVQLVNLLQDGEQVAMSTRAGKFETLSDVVAETGADAARFIFLSRKSDSHLDFDLELVKKKSMENPVYYVQYAHARICSVQRKAEESGMALPVLPLGEADTAGLALLDTPEDLELLGLLDQYPDVLAASAKALAPHMISFYLRELAQALHRYYQANQVLSVEEGLRRARLMLLAAVAQTVRNGLDALGVSAPDRM
jgi:arginyl-tRNA synthetase